MVPKTNKQTTHDLGMTIRLTTEGIKDNDYKWATIFDGCKSITGKTGHGGTHACNPSAQEAEAEGSLQILRPA